MRQEVKNKKEEGKNKKIGKVHYDDWMKQWPELHPIRKDLTDYACRKEKDSYIKRDFMSRSEHLNCGIREQLL